MIWTIDIMLGHFFSIIWLEYVHHVCSGGSCLDSCLTQRRSLNINTSVFGLACHSKTVFLIHTVLVLVLFNSDYIFDTSWPQSGLKWPSYDCWTWKYTNVYEILLCNLRFDKYLIALLVKIIWMKLWAILKLCGQSFW